MAHFFNITIVVVVVIIIAASSIQTSKRLSGKGGMKRETATPSAPSQSLPSHDQIKMEERLKVGINMV